MMKKLLKIIEIAMLLKSALFPNYLRYLPHILMAQIEDLNGDWVKISRSYLLYYLRNKLSNSVTIGLGRVKPVHRFE